eukprot:CAMPEP_0198343960 /NCGR_PEP_ID=MMETSP1450-20131203/64066_1 /TAXON_ID=753684 ORGANISM="Madagascaria erythrocladiodes, Strain CCMP3234" /NCGR_SAMPLE_ID=MMETSP1450 /ASSEMBLY_ACC=CAM_ASM_001115 /LENGTH=77 /DNA_ID=CAMNT_0044049181 /DNA_START=513 /DNA_END=742 /DNA_ORIENTATION=-
MVPVGSQGSVACGAQVGGGEAKPKACGGAEFGRVEPEVHALERGRRRAWRKAPALGALRRSEDGRGLELRHSHVGGG